MLNSREIVWNVLRGLETPRPACGPLAVHFCARDAGRSIRDFTLQPQVMADCIVRYYEKYRPDVVWVSADTWVTAQAAGAIADFPDGDEPIVGQGMSIIAKTEDLERLPTPDPTTQGRQPLMLEAMRRVRQTLGEEVFIVACFDQAPFSLACALMGINHLMIKLIDDCAFVNALLDRCVEYCVAYGSALAAAGADMLSMGDSPAGLIGPDLYREFALPREKAVFSNLREQSNCALSLHICGNSQAILSDMDQAGADVLELDHLVPIELACRQVSRETTIWGTLDPVSVLLNGTPEHVTHAVHQVLKSIEQCEHNRFVLSSGCTLAPATPAANLHAMIQAARDWV